MALIDFDETSEIAALGMLGKNAVLFEILGVMVKLRVLLAAEVSE